MFRIVFTLFMFLLPSAYAEAGSWLDDYQAAAEEMVADFNRGSTSRFTTMLDRDVIVDEIMDGISGEPEQLAGLRSGFNKALAGAGEKLISQIPDGGYVKLLRVGRKDASVRALVRFDFGDNGFGYCDFVLKQTDNKGVVIRDWFDFSSGRFYSEAVRSMILVALNRVDDLRGITKADLKHNDVLAFFRMFRGKQFKQAIKTYKELSERMRRNRNLIYVYVQTAAMSGDMELYREALEELNRYYGDDPRFSLLLVDYFFLGEDYPGAVRVLDMAGKDMGLKDAALLAMQGNAWLSAGEYKKALHLSEKARRMEPELETPYWALLQLYALKGDFDNTVATARVLRDRFSYLLDAEFFSGSDAFAAFAKSDQYQEWIGQFE